VSLTPILYAEDDQNDTFFLERAFKLAGIANPLVTVPDGQAAIDYCLGCGPYADRAEHPLPCLLLLDLNMPKKSGMEVLTCIRQEPSLRTLPIIVLTSSLQDSDIHRAYLNGANAYLTKPSQPEGLVVMAKAIHDFWLTQNCIAQKSPDPLEAARIH
jgi:CheY-like chemotaxis protein